MSKKIITYILTFFLTVFICLIIASLILSNTILKEKYVLKSLEKNNYYERTYNDITDGFKNYIMQSGLEESILEGLCSKEKVKNDVNEVISAVYENREINVETESIKQELDNRINKVLEENNRKPDKQEKESIEAFEKAIVDTYSNVVVLSKDNVEQIGDIYAKVQSVIKLVEIACIIILAILLVVIALINKNSKEFLKALGTALLANGILCSLLKLLIGDRIHYIVILSTTFSETIINMAYSIINTFLIIGIISIILGLAAIIIGNNKQTLD